ncbi:MAG TPA: hypothetical protein VF532_08195 [Candidatus Angelobacter sp.]
MPVQSHITGGPWTLQQTGSSNAAPSAGYCVNGVPQPNPGTERMAPYYFPFVTGSGQNLHGIFDYRPRTSNEAVVAASSSDGGLTWEFEQEALELNKGVCPASDLVDIGNDNGLGHGYSLTVNGVTFLYNLDRAPANVDRLGMVVHQLTPLPGAPLNPTPDTLDIPQRTTGLLNPDGIIAQIPGVTPTTIYYLQKILNGDRTGPTALPLAQQCGTPVIFKEPAASHDIVIPRMASTTDGINFTDLGPVNGLNDPTGVGPTDIRYVGPRGTVLQLPGERWGLFFSGGNCLDGDSDAFHFIGYAESTDLVNWTVINGIQNPIASIKPLTVVFNGVSVTVPANTPVVGSTQGWFEGRVYSPSFTWNGIGRKGGILHFAGYHTPRPNDDRSDYRNVGRVGLQGTRPILAISNGDDQDQH